MWPSMLEHDCKLLGAPHRHRFNATEIFGLAQRGHAERNDRHGAALVAKRAAAQVGHGASS